ncbi:MAG TPA: hypothetical protein VFZ27_00180 [Terriglobia bacterium]|nr:hypothetical protein [Terriglobia bacterium]
MSSRVFSVLFVVGCTVGARSQENPQHYLERAIIAHNQSYATVEANSPRPLLQAITAVREEYGWIVEYEDPPYEGSVDLVKDSSISRTPEGLVFLIPAGGAFQSTYPETPDTRGSPDGELEVLGKIVSDYNATKNPGKFVVRALQDGSYALIGQSSENSDGKEVSVPPVLDTTISLPGATRSAAVTIKLILVSLNKASSTKVGLGMVPINAFVQSQVTVGGSNVSAREFLVDVIDQIKAAKLIWELNFDPDGRVFYLNLLPATQAHYNSSGKRTTTILR